MPIVTPMAIAAKRMIHAQDRHQYSDLEEISHEERHGAEPGRRGQVAGQDCELSQATEMDEDQAGKNAESYARPLPPGVLTPCPPLRAAERGNEGLSQPSHRKGRNRIRQQIPARRAYQPRHAEERHSRREHREPRGAHREIEDHAERAEWGAEQAANEQHGHRLQRHGDGRAGQRNGHLRCGGNEQRTQHDTHRSPQHHRTLGLN